MTLVGNITHNIGHGHDNIDYSITFGPDLFIVGLSEFLLCRPLYIYIYIKAIGFVLLCNHPWSSPLKKIPKKKNIAFCFDVGHSSFQLYLISSLTIQIQLSFSSLSFLKPSPTYILSFHNTHLH